MTSRNERKLTVVSGDGSKPVAQSHFHFIKSRLDKLPVPSNGQRAYYYDDVIRGLALAVTPAGKKTFLLYRKVMGRPERIAIGPYPDLSIEQARGEAEKLNGAIARGENPGEKRRTVRDEMTLGELFEQYLEHHAKPYKKTWSDDVSQFNRHLRPWRLRTISSIRKIDVVTLHTRVGANAKYAANRMVELLSSMFSKAAEWGWTGENPAAKVQPFKEHKRDRFLQASELPAFFHALAEESNEVARDYIFVALFTGARKTNVLEMRWQEISFERALWRIPETKNGEMLEVHLSQEALRVLRSRQAASKGEEWVFPSSGRTGHLVEPKTAWRRILKRAGIANLRLHDLRRTLGSWQAGTGASLPIIGKSLGHKNTATTAIYARLNLDPVRAAVDKATAAMMLAASAPVALLKDKNK